jgi:ribosomal protein S6--L-glutamate ligase
LKDLVTLKSSGPATPIKVGLVVENRYLSQQQPKGLISALQARGHQVMVIDPEAAAYRVGDDGWLDGMEVIVGRGRSVGLQYLLKWAEAKGKPTINPTEAIAAVLNKAEMTMALVAAGIPTPMAFLGSIPELMRSIPESCYPITLKPIFGDNCRGIFFADSPGDLLNMSGPDAVVLAQQFVANEGYDLKLYGIGKDVWAVRKPSCLAKTLPYHFTTQEMKSSTLVSMADDMKSLALRCAEIFGLELYGVDCIETREGLQVIEVNDYPNYTGIPGVDEHLADYIIHRALR